MPPRRHATRRLIAAATAVGGLALAGHGASATGPDRHDGIRAPREFSGIAWLATVRHHGPPGEEAPSQEVFLVCHDTRDNDAERDLPRLSLVKTPVDTDGIVVRELDVDFPDVPNDLESIARLPGRDQALLVESNADGDDPDPTIYLVAWDRKLRMRVVDSVPWPKTPEPHVNVEATGVAKVRGRDYFVYAERAEGSDTTRIHMTRLTVGREGGIVFGTEWTSIPFTAPEPPGARPASGLDIGAAGEVYVSSAYDPGDLGPFDSAVYHAADVRAGGPIGARLEPVAPPRQLARSSGLKVEGVALVDGSPPLFIGDDDEDYGGLLRQLRVTDPAVDRRTPAPTR
ncbi:hypothetical protein [Streptomyces sp. HSG2]|uniref:hypothetical protein n=1 Tax=Streptomyces sp. HSG2 TaxID=2797167 RepID=UPI0019075DEC|nr:hypothetical protein [Streptomyces sp. HSG2]